MITTIKFVVVTNDSSHKTVTLFQLVDFHVEMVA